MMRISTINIGLVYRLLAAAPRAVSNLEHRALQYSTFFGGGRRKDYDEGHKGL